MLIGYLITWPDNDSYMFSSWVNNLEKCPKCGYFTDFFDVSPDFKVTKRMYDISYTYDDYCIVSRKFKEFCQRFNYSNINFIKLPNDKDFFFFLPNETLSFDSNKRNIRFENLCSYCNNYESVVGATPCFLKNTSKPVSDNFYKTDILFGSGNEKSPLIIIGKETAERLKKEKFNNISFEEIKS